MSKNILSKKEDKELNKAFKDSKERGFGVYDSEKKLCINPEALTFVWDSKKRENKMLQEVVLLRSLMNIKNIYKEKFGNDEPMNLELFNKDIELFIERLIRAVEICTLNYVLQTGEGALNDSKRMNIVKGRRRFIWEDW